MVVNVGLIRECERRLSFDPEKQSTKLGEGNRGRWLTAEQKEHRLRLLMSETDSPERAQLAFERIIEGNDLVSINYLEKGVVASRPVCRIQLRNGSGDILGYGTGFLIGPGLLMTNHHVFGRAEEASYAVADFDYELDINGRERPMIRFAFEPDRFFYANEGLDFAVVAVKPTSMEGGRGLEEWGWLTLSGDPGKGTLGEYLTIIQHPEGQLKQICVRENKLLEYTENTLWYKTDTLGGSSGSPVFNQFWQVVGLHHSGVPEKDKNGNWLTWDGGVWDASMGENRIKWKANEAIRISSIVQHLQERFANQPLLMTALGTKPPTPEWHRESVSRSVLPAVPAGYWAEIDGVAVSLVVPLRIPLEVVRRAIGPSPRPPAAVSVEPVASVPPTAVVGVLPIEKVEIDQTTLESRPGYDPSFLGIGKLTVPLPSIPDKLKESVATLVAVPGESELKYFNYSVVINKDRKLAFYAAVNIDGKLRRNLGKREGDAWLRDPRITENAQIGDEFYRRQKELEVDRTENPFDRGHLVRRLDATWGTTDAEAKQHGDDTFHFTNCSPQFFAFNQGKKLWAGIEEYVLDQLEAEERKACVINGPVFDGPVADEGGLPDPEKPGKRDPKFKEVAIPKYFWKLMVIERGGKLAASAFLLSQQDQVLGIDRIQEEAVFEKLTAAQAKVFQISIQDLAKFTGLDFGKLAEVDTKEAARAAKPRPIESLNEIRF